MKNILLIIFIFVTSHFNAQLDPRLGYDLFKATNYIEATKELKKHLKVDPKDSKALFYVGLCYLNSNINKAAAVTYLEKCKSTDKPDKELLFYLSIAYSHNYNYEKAKELMKEYIAEPGKNIDKANAILKGYDEAKQLYDNAEDVTFLNLGEKNNSPDPDYNPFCAKDESMIVFTTRREEGKGRREFDGYYPSDIFLTKYDGFRFANAKSANLNSSFDESCVGIHDDGSEIFLYFDNITVSGEIYFSEQSGGGFSKKKKISEGVNDEKSIETAASISSDLNTLFFASNRDGGAGGLDLFMTRKLPNGKWAAAQNIKAINTPGHEDFPTLTADGQTLYFCSDGLGGMGGYDLFKSTWNSETNEWSEPKNLGYPINTSYDDKVISFTSDAKHAYVSQVREEGYGDFDIYRITLNERNVNPAIFSVDIQDGVTSKNVEECMVYVYDETDEIVGEYTSNGGNTIFLALKPGKYLLEIESDGYQFSEQTLKVSEFDSEKGISNITYKLSK